MILKKKILNYKAPSIFLKTYDKTIESIQEDYIWNKENDKDKDKGKDDYEIGM